MAAYAALCSLAHIVEQIQHHPSPPISLDQQQVESLTERVTSLQQFLEGYSDFGGYTKEADPLESRIADAAHAAEDVIESHIVDEIHAGSTSHAVKISSVDFYQGLQKVIGDMDFIKEEVIEIKDKTRVRNQQQRNSTPPADDSSIPSSTGQNTMVGCDDALLEILDKLTGGHQYRQVIPIVGMGGMGKTTLARNVYVNPLIQEYFDICAWATISQEYNTREILREILCPESKEELTNIEELGERLYKHFSGRRYLIILDDMWSIEAWNVVRRFFPDNNNGSKIIITTRLSNLTSQLTSSYKLEMEFLDNDKSWNLLCKTVFGEEGCPLELEKIGKMIVKNCRGLPLSIIVTAGLLVKSKHSCEYWEYIAKNMSSLVNSDDNERCLNILYLSYKQMPIFLKPCFLYMGVFPEDSTIRTKELIRLWVAEGFLKPTSGKCLEEVAEEFLEELIDRNLIHASRLGKLKYCSMHDLLRDLCLREAEKERFYYVTKEYRLNDSSVINTQRRIVVPRGTSVKEVIDKLKYMSVARSFIWEGGLDPLSLNCRLLRVLFTYRKYGGMYLNHGSSVGSMLGLVNSRYFATHVNRFEGFPSSISLLWNLQTLTVENAMPATAPAEIWKIPYLRHVKFNGGLHLPDPPIKDDDDIVLTNLQTLSTIRDFKCSAEVIQKIPNLKQLKIVYRNDRGSLGYSLNNLDRLHKLESFDCNSYLLQKPKEIEFLQKPKEIEILHKLSFPRSLKKLTLKVGYFSWDDIMEKIVSLPLLEVLILSHGSFKGCAWETAEGQFSSLKSLNILFCVDLHYWNSESTHFPCLEQLVLKNLPNLKEIPSGIGDIPTLQSIQLYHCSYSAAVSAKKILEEQEDFGDVTLQVGASHYNEEEEEALKRLASSNFKVLC